VYESVYQTNETIKYHTVNEYK